MSKHNVVSRRWQKLSITAKFSLAFSLLLFLILSISVSSYFALTTIRHQTETAILTSTEIQRLVLEMDADLQEARRLQRDFFLRYPSIGFGEARQIYAQQASQQIDKVVALSSQLQQLISESDVTSALRESGVNLNLYLSASNRYATTLDEAVELVAQLASDETGLQMQLAQKSTALRDILQIADDPNLIVVYREMQSFEKDYLITRQRPLMQSAFNVAFLLRQEIEAIPMLEEDQKAQALAYLDDYQFIAKEILDLDVTIRSKIREFDLQAEAVDPITAELVTLANDEVERARAQINQTSQLALVGLLAATLVGVVLTRVIALVLDRSITRNVVKLTETAKQLQSHNMSARTSIKSDDEIGLLASTFNQMASELQELYTSLEQQVISRTERLQKQTIELAEARKRAEEANRAKSQFLSNMSHELRTPLNGILGFAHILKQHVGLDDTQVDGLNIIQQSGEHLLTLINDILDLSKIEAGKMGLNPIPIHLPTFLNGIANFIRTQATTKNIHFNFDMTNTLPTGVVGDETRLRQILLNLLGNAIKFTDRGQVALRVWSKKGAESPSTSNAPSYLHFEVEDSGIGISSEQLEKIFEPFEQIGRGQQQGTGLGLAISRQMVQLMGGDLFVRSKAGQGSTFWFEILLPLIDIAPEVAARPERVITGYKGRRRTVLVADDIVLNRAVMTGLLTPLGFEIVEAEDEEKAVALARETQPDLIFMDRWMPRLDGFEAVRQIRQIPALQEVPIIAISAGVSAEDQAQSRRVGYDGFLPKPIHWHKLAVLLEEHLDLEWEYKSEDEGERIGSEDIQPSELVPPPAQEIEVLYKLAMVGNMRRIQEQADHLEALAGRYRPFASQLHALAKGFQSKAILALLEQYRDRE